LQIAFIYCLAAQKQHLLQLYVSAVILMMTSVYIAPIDSNCIC